MIYGWENGAEVLAVPKPWARSAERRTAVWPDPLLGVFSSVAQRLAGRRVLTRLGLGHGLVCMILSGSPTGTLVVWNTSADQTEVVKAMCLGDDPVTIDLWGNRQKVEQVKGKHRWRIGQSPVFLAGIDAELAQWRARFRLDEPFIQSTQTPHTRTLLLTNLWPHAVTGQFMINGPKGWNVRPALHEFSLGPGQSFRAPVRLSFPMAELVGQKELTARFDFTAVRRYQVDMSTPLDLGFSDIQYQASLRLVPGQRGGVQDAILTAIVTNTGDRNRALYLFANLRSHRRQERIVAPLESGQTAVRHFHFSNVGNLLRTTAVHAGIRETKGPAVLNNMVSLANAL